MAYVVRFTYPPEPVGDHGALHPRRPRPSGATSAYTYTGSRAALPSLVFDDGRFTYFQWPEQMATPALFVVAPGRVGSIVNYGVRDGYVVVEQLAPHFRLRNGREVTTVINGGWREPTPGPAAPRPNDAKTAKEAVRAGVRP
jgi:type IV secretion system protein VirB9